VVHGEKESINTLLKASVGDFVDVGFGLNTSLVVRGEENLNDRVQLEAHGD
jgi:hypothetical protein